MNREEIVLAALAAGGENAIFEPVHVQKLLYIIDREAPHLTGGPHFNFAPYDYGPFDKEVYDTLDRLNCQNTVNIMNNGRYRIYTLNGNGYQVGRNILAQTSPATQKYLQELAYWVKSLPFEKLVSAIYSRYPEMRANSVFRG
ncbi:hypothetical protein F1643_00640 [Azospirillum sp. INR13]|uniref:hypothetical protein n=1 Tax=Azospirillum sp. INR13 TaxID=2596919 RepID=UPI00189230AE|nr:hypothetical protein [Azospirillum sp. INR13]MBF5093190.1 hypothetical protein [Azospirillum sp. INR13]